MERFEKITRTDKPGIISPRLWLLAAILLALFVAFGVYVYWEKRVDRANERRQLTYELADQLRQSSDDMTRMVRTYVITGNRVYKQAFQDILDIRDGLKPRPKGYSLVYWDLVLVKPESTRTENGTAIALLELLRQAGVTDEEFRMLEEAKAKSDHLAILELEASKLMESVGAEAEANRAKARLMLHDTNYHQAKAAIMQPISEFFLTMEKRTRSDVDMAIKLAYLFRMLFIAATLGALFTLWQEYRNVRATLGGSVEEVHTHLFRMGQGDFSHAIETHPGIEGSVIDGLAAMKANLQSQETARRAAQEELRVLNEQLEYRVIQRTAELSRARDEADQANQAKSEFLSSMSHELRTPLNAVLGFSQLLAVDPELSPEKQDMVREIEHGGTILLKLVTDVLNLSGIESGRMELAMEPLTVKTMTDKCFRLVAIAGENAGVELIDAGGNGKDVAIRVDPVRLQQVVLNLLTNAIKYNRQNGSVRLSYILSDSPAHRAVRIVVSDTGVGIPADKQARIFGAFDRLGFEHGTIEGTGIGLLITKRIVEAMGGTVGFTSAEGQGSTFWAEFPVLRDRPTVSPSTSLDG